MRHYLLIFLVVLTAFVAAQQVVRFNHLGTEDGLTSGRYNSYFHQDRFGYVWISSTAGLNRFDGKQIKTYHREPNDSTSLLTQVSAQSRFAEMPDGDLFFAAAAGFSRYNRKTDDFSHFEVVSPTGDTARSVYLWCYLADGKEHLFVSGGRKLYRVNPQKPAEHELIDDQFVYLKDRMYTLGQDSFLLVHFRPNSGRLRWTTYEIGQGKTAFRDFTAPAGSTVNDITIVNSDSLLVATDSGLWSYLISKDEWVLNKGTESLNVVETERSGNRRLSLGVRGGEIYSYAVNSGQLTVLMDNDGSEIDTFRAEIERLHLTEEGVLWVATTSSGVFFADVNEKNFETQLWHLPGDFPGVFGMTEGKDNSIYFLLKGKMGIRKDGKIAYVKLPVDGAEFDEYSGITHDRKGRIWLSTYSHLYLRDTPTEAFRKYELPMPSGELYEKGYFAPSYLPDGRLLLPLNGGHCFALTGPEERPEPWLTEVTRVRSAVFDDSGHGVVTSFNDSLHLVSTRNGKERLDSSLIRLGMINGVRVGEGLALTVEFAGEVDPVFTWLPTMILQPFVDNAIWHGFGGREEAGTVTLRFRTETEHLLRVEVEDNGRGRGCGECY